MTNRQEASTSQEQDSPLDRRAEEHHAATGNGGLPGHDSLSLLRGIEIKDILWGSEHTDDFRETRSGYIRLRIRFMALFFAVAVPLWIPIDFITLAADDFTLIAVARLVLAGALLGLGVQANSNKFSFAKTHALLAGLIVLPTLFYVVAMQVLSEVGGSNIPVGYTFMPYLIVTMLAVYPLTLLGSCGLIGLVFAAMLGAETFFGELISFDTLNKLWLFGMFAGITLWTQSGQLLMLLRLYRESSMDPLTGLINRRVLMKRLDAEVAYQQRYGDGFSVLMFDLDRFKRVNDQYGHLTGDKVLRTVSTLLLRQMRSHDILARFGGEEFTAVLPGLNGEAAVAVAERVRQACEQTKVEAPNGDIIPLSSSVGVTAYEPGESVHSMLARVDDSLYKAKELGRNRVIYSQSGDDQRQMVA